MSDNKNQSNNRKSDLLSKEVEHIDITSFDARKIVSSMEKCIEELFREYYLKDLLDKLIFCKS